uniref:Methylase of polypeptide chain release factors n=1 Tax=uncultured Rhodospirillales bacterium HF0070_31K06 TaxID=710786 RepID=E0XSQ3_9PROT|nr:methylase of polypeptide chain release factors [uncultured Rhodospirillales bacterium HF0070_31K06]
MSHITGSREFRSLRFEVTADVLDPRPDSEVLIEAALALLPATGEPFNVLDLGTGTGCLLLAVLNERPAATGIGVDLSEAALAVARRNAWKLGLAERAQFRRGDWSNGLGGTFDLVLSNPPYIPSAEIDQLEPEVACHEPRLALDGGADGLDAYRAIAQRTPQLLANKGALIVEFGTGQAEAVCAIFAQHGLAEARLECDLAGRPRCFIATV